MPFHVARHAGVFARSVTVTMGQCRVKASPRGCVALGVATKKSRSISLSVAWPTGGVAAQRVRRQHWSSGTGHVYMLLHPRYEIERLRVCLRPWSRTGRGGWANAVIAAGSAEVTTVP